MIELASRWRVLAAGTAVGVAAVVGFAGQTASAEPLLPAPSVPGPVPATPAAPAPAPAPGLPQLLGLQG
ncbi:hypothetical protein [Mycolicibacterium neworleansense]|uniref:Uncharacterized protein n=1 Tax=Mycolicibacterium neworleansense TaxID=146018 RepID=A0A0H5RST3_9MYCO|nr:hypothetical protein [Mycolicibacterium neworleansense]CRZ17245.1 hypothetical protein BN2156_04130 [Mycolicibacterium neworleansense]